MKIVQDIWHGDSRQLVQRFKDKSIQSIITDPPFGVNNQSNSAVTPDGKAAARKIANDESPEIAMQVFREVMAAAMPKMKDESDIYVFTSYQVLEEWLAFTRELFAPYDYQRKALLVWEKDGPGQGDLSSWGMGMEFVLYFKRGSRVPTAKRRNSVLRYSQVRPDDLIHPHEKPLPMLQDLLKYSVDPGEYAVDLFGGSGSLARAGKVLGNRGVISIEYDEYNYTLAKKALDEQEEALF